MKRNERGITLIVLVIAIIILLILGGVSISSIVNGGGIVERAGDTVSQWNSAIEENQGRISNAWNVINSKGNTNNGGATATPTPAAALPAGWSQTSVASAYPSADAAQKAPIPKGFVASSATGENSIATGLVIYKGTEAVTDTNVATAQTTRDQYVWIPVDNSTAITWSNETEDNTVLDDGDGTNVDETQEANLTLTTDFNAMKTSVQTYGGFYISRYELGGTVANPTSRKGQTVLTASSSSANQWYGLYDAAHKNITDGANTVLSGHMIFGSEYAKVLAFIDSNNASYSTTGHDTKQQTVKHASGIIAEGQTGKELDTINNIVDLEGNVFEWTAQAVNTNNRVWRGGYYSSADSGYFGPASYGISKPTSTSSGRGTRQALYVTL